MILIKAYNKMIKYIIKRASLHFQSFSKVKEMTERTSSLIKIDSLHLDAICEEFMEKYGVMK